ncbi:nucleotidyltransferase [bacterium (Candidatus Gribaldobacteria) CG_4_8_14_3_um_filter_42_11]|uniref:Nucleotidyltransferase n=1 Tax=bacterium (Candidatus Gribaldobacteria) CG_4_8_14_3_um_filter_42_11 TaxID=2014267 RepID=A0A2M7IY47_9BACT|nr:MAG: nucleotidyltransferase [bacterium (Candidatus Gribaldobacteria) CG_4_8_14_3_um_filter_42_11]
MNKLENLILDLTKANKALKQATRLSSTRINKDASIQRFEFTFELCWKTMQEYIRDQGFDCKSPKSCVRKAASLDLLKNPESWLEFLQARNLIAHTYNEDLADSVYKKAVEFPKEVDKLLKELENE